jgi:hypothetical protein
LPDRPSTLHRATSAHVASEPILAEIDAIGASQIAEAGKQKRSSRAGAGCTTGSGHHRHADRGGDGAALWGDHLHWSALLLDA